MKKLIAALLLLSAASSLALAQGTPQIGIFDNDAYDTYICYGNWAQYVAHVVYVAAWLPPEIPGISAVEFAVSGLPSPADAIMTPTWTTPLVIGTLDYDISLAWTNCQFGPWVLIGSISFFPLVNLPADHVMTVVQGGDCGCLVVVDCDFLTVNAVGGIYTINCSVPETCVCFHGTPTEDATWGSVKSLY